MSIFRCSKCGCVENTATSNYWTQRYPMEIGGKELKDAVILCSQCDPEINQWHGDFPRMAAKGFILCSDGFLYSKEDVASINFDTRSKIQGLTVVREITEDMTMDADQVYKTFLDTLNEAVQADPKAMLNLCESRVLCNDELADHPTIQVSGLPGQPARVGIIGVINGICEKLTGKRVAADYDAEGNLIAFVEYMEQPDEVDIPFNEPGESDEP